MTFMESVLKLVEERKKNHRKRIISSKKSDTTFTQTPVTSRNKHYSLEIKNRRKRTILKSSFKVRDSRKAGLQIGIA